MIYGILPNLTKDYILSKVSQEQIFEKYLGIRVEFNILLKAPSSIRANDNKPTCSFYYTSNGKLRFKDHAGYFHGDCFEAVALVYRLNCQNKNDFGVILDTIARDFRVHKYEGGTNVSTGNTYSTLDVSGKREKTKIIFKVRKREWYRPDIRFWTQGFYGAKTLETMKIFPCQYIWKNDQLVYNYVESDPAYGYYFGDGNFKFYFPKRKDFRFLSNCSVLQGKEQLFPNLFGLVTKSYKDVGSIRNFGIPAVAPSSETHLIPLNEWNEIKWNCEHWFSLMDYDRAGIRMAWKLREEYNIQPLFFAKKFRDRGIEKTLPKLYNQFTDYGIKDFFEFGSRYGKDKTDALILDTIEKFEDRFSLLNKYYYDNLNFLNNYE